MILLLILQLLLITSADEGRNCDDMKCSNFVDYVCGQSVSSDGHFTYRKYQNICHLNKIKCRLNNEDDLSHVSDSLCHIRPKKFLNTNGRRLAHIGISGGHQACNHTCPTYCIDTYSPTCAKIWKIGNKGYKFRPMLNHCHIDLLSCVVGVNITIEPLVNCYDNPNGLTLITHIANMKSLGILDNSPDNYKAASRRRSYDGTMSRIPSHNLEVLRRLLENYVNS